MGQNNDRMIAAEALPSIQGSASACVAQVLLLVRGVIDIGPGAVEEGGRVVCAAPLAVVARAVKNRTAPYLARELG